MYSFALHDAALQQPKVHANTAQAQVFFFKS